MTSVLIAGNVAQAGALIYIFKRMEALIKRGQDREDALQKALLGRLGEDDAS